MKLLGLFSSLKYNSCNAGLLKYIKHNIIKNQSNTISLLNCGANISMDIADISTLPLYNSDYYKNSALLPLSIIEYQLLLRNCDAIIFSSSEFPLG